MLIEKPNPYSMQLMLDTNSFTPMLRIFKEDKYLDVNIEDIQDRLTLQDAALSHSEYSATVLSILFDKLDADANFSGIRTDTRFLKAYMEFTISREQV